MIARLLILLSVISDIVSKHWDALQTVPYACLHELTIIGIFIV